MNRDGNLEPGGPENHGPITPPSLGEIYEISSRRQRTRYRLMQGTLVAVVIAGVGLGLRGRDASIGTDLDGVPIAEAASPAENGVSEGGDLARETTTSSPPSDPCFLASPGPEMAAWMVDGREAYLGDLPIPVTEVEELTALWQIPFDEVKALVGLAERGGSTLDVDAIDDAFSNWQADGYTGDQLGAIAAEWNVSTISVKVLNMIGGSELQASLAACGLSQDQS